MWEDTSTKTLLGSTTIWAFKDASEQAVERLLN
jgi:hypothetical protein